MGENTLSHQYTHCTFNRSCVLVLHNIVWILWCYRLSVKKKNSIGTRYNYKFLSLNKIVYSTSFGDEVERPFCCKVSFVSDPRCEFLGVGQSMKQTGCILYLNKRSIKPTHVEFNERSSPI